MKKMVSLVALLILIVSTDVSARGFVNNPDRFPSVGLSFGFTSLGGDASFPGVTPAAAPVGVDIQKKDLRLDFRLPVSHSLTVFGEISVIIDEFTIDVNNINFEQDRESDGYGIRFGARFYFNR